MRTLTFLVAGALLMASALLVAKPFSEHYPSAPNGALAIASAAWLAVVGFNLWIGVSKAGYAFGEELPILLMLFLLPVGAAVLVRWRFF